MTNAYLTDRLDNHDAQCAVIAGQLIKLGFFLEELQTYAIVYYENEQRKYYFCSNFEQMQRYANSLLRRNLYCLPIIKFTQEEKIHLGEQEQAKKNFIHASAKKLQKMYSLDYLKEINTMTSVSGNNAAEEILDEISYRISGHFDYGAFCIFEGLVDSSFVAKKIDLDKYLKYCRWLNTEKQHLEEDYVKKGNYERVFSGFAYVDEAGKINYYSNALGELTEMRKIELMQKGIQTTPIFSKKFSFNGIAEMPIITAKFDKEIQERLGEEYHRIWRYIWELPCGIDQSKYRELYNQFNVVGNQDEKAALNYLGKVFQVYNEF